MSNDLYIDKISDNKLIINGKEYFGIGISNVFVGKEPNVERFDESGNPSTLGEYTKDENGNLIKIPEDKYNRLQEVYNLQNQKHHNWVLIDLETGRGNSPYPGCKKYCYTICDTTYIYSVKNTASDVLMVLGKSDMRLEVLEDEKDTQNKFWYKVKFSDNSNDVGYVRVYDVSEIEYANY